MEKILVFMSTYNGTKYLNAQLQSIFRQKEVAVKLIVRDDGSTDDTKSVINDYINKGFPIELYYGKNLRTAKSFMWLVSNYDITDYKYFAFCDQDDVWLNNKLSVAIDILKKSEDVPSVYYCATKNVDSSLNPIGTLFTETKHTLSLIDSIATGSLIPGCTMVFNLKLMKLLKLYSPKNITMHDTWAHLVCLSCRGCVYGDETPYILYRQHENNVLGVEEKSTIDKIKGISNLENNYSKMVEELFNNYSIYMDDSNLKLLKNCINYKKSFLDKVHFLNDAVNSTLEFKPKVSFIIKIIFSKY